MLAFVVASHIPTPASAANVYSATMDVWSTEHFLDSTDGWVTVDRVRSSDPSPVYLDFGADKELEVTFKAPPGMRFAISAPPAGLTFSNYLLGASFATWDDWMWISIPPLKSPKEPTSSFSGADGAGPISSVIESWEGASLFDDALTLMVEGKWDLSDAFTFESLTINLTLPNEFNHQIESDRVHILLYLFSSVDGRHDPGSDPRLTLAPIAAVPSSGTLALLGVGFAGFTASRIRRRGSEC